MQVGQPLRKAFPPGEESPNSAEQGAPRKAGAPATQGAGDGKCHRKQTTPPQAGKGCNGEVRAHRPVSNDGGTTNPTRSKTK